MMVPTTPRPVLMTDRYEVHTPAHELIGVYQKLHFAAAAQDWQLVQECMESLSRQISEGIYGPLGARNMQETMRRPGPASPLVSNEDDEPIGIAGATDGSPIRCAAGENMDDRIDGNHFKCSAQCASMHLCNIHKGYIRTEDGALYCFNQQLDKQMFRPIQDKERT